MQSRWCFESGSRCHAQVHSSGHSAFVLHEGATLLDLREKVQQFAFDANGLTPILGADTAPLSSVGLGQESVIFLSNVMTVTPAPTPADSSHDVARPAFEHPSQLASPGLLAS